MPSTATITSMYTFVANTRAKAAEVNSNFSNYRGHIIPIEPLTQTSAHLTYDLGSTDHAWRVGYVQTLHLIGATSTAAVQIKGLSAVTAGGAEILVGGATIGSILTTGIQREALVNANAYMTTTALTTGLFDSSSTTYVTVTNMSLAFTIKKGPVEISLCNGLTSTSFSYIEISGATQTLMNIRVIRDTTTSIVENCPSRIRLDGATTTSILGVAPSYFRWIDDPGAGTYTYSLQASLDSTGSTMRFNQVRMRIREL